MLLFSESVEEVHGWKRDVVYAARLIGRSKSTSPSVPLTRRIESAAHHDRNSDNSCFLLHRPFLELRGGSDQEDDEEYYDEEEEEEEDMTSVVEVSTDSVLDLSKRVAGLLGELAVQVVQLSSRVVLAVFHVGEDEVKVTGLSRLWSTLQRMWKAAWNEEDGSNGYLENEVSVHVPPKPPKKASSKATTTSNAHKTAVKQADLGTFLSQSYAVEATRDDLENVHPVLGGTISDALQLARSKARLLVVLIPTNKPGSKKGTTLDEEAIRGFLSAEVAMVAEKRSRKKEETGSFLLWSAKAGSAEAVAAIKRLKAAQTNSKGQNRPVLLVTYPHHVIDRGIVPRLLAQHHCSPPPSPDIMAAWLNALRKRHAKQYASMQLERREEQLYKDRREGYVGSIQSDRERQERERREKEQKLAEEKAELERKAAILERRQELQASLPDEPPPSSSSAFTIALRFADGRSTQRRFDPDTKLSSLFNWVDANYGMERELITLTTLNGQKSFDWDEESDMVLSDAGFGRMTGLRVTERKGDTTNGATTAVPTT